MYFAIQYYPLMQKRSYYIVNGITLYRLLAAPLLIVLIIYYKPGIFKWLLVLSFFTDAIDGYLARRFRVASILGSKLDSIADDLTILAALAGMYVFKQEFLKQELVLILLPVALFLLQTVLALIRYGKATSFHTYGAKTAAIFQGIFILLLFFLPEPVYILFYIAVIVTILELLEEIILLFLIPKWQTDIKGLYWVLKEKSA